MKKIFDFIKSPKFFGMSCLIAAWILFGLIIPDDMPFWFLMLYVIVFWGLTIKGCYILDRLNFDKELNLWIKHCYDEQIYRECDKGEKEFDIDIPSKIAAENYTKYVGKNFPYFSSLNNFNNTYIITDARINEDDITYTTITFTKIKD